MGHGREGYPYLDSDAGRKGLGHKSQGHSSEHEELELVRANVMPTLCSERKQGGQRCMAVQW